MIVSPTIVSANRALDEVESFHYMTSLVRPQRGAFVMQAAFKGDYLDSLESSLFWAANN